MLEENIHQPDAFQPGKPKVPIINGLLPIYKPLINNFLLFIKPSHLFIYLLESVTKPSHPPTVTLLALTVFSVSLLMCFSPQIFSDILSPNLHCMVYSVEYTVFARIMLVILFLFFHHKLRFGSCYGRNYAYFLFQLKTNLPWSALAHVFAVYTRRAF